MSKKNSQEAKKRRRMERKARKCESLPSRATHLTDFTDEEVIRAREAMTLINEMGWRSFTTPRATDDPDEATGLANLCVRAAEMLRDSIDEGADAWAACSIETEDRLYGALNQGMNSPALSNRGVAGYVCASTLKTLRMRAEAEPMAATVATLINTSEGTVIIVAGADVVGNHLLGIADTTSRDTVHFAHYEDGVHDPFLEAARSGIDFSSGWDEFELSEGETQPLHR